ncbi:topoisomerase DNA-binding C4 zinc finger domain-containing protein [Sphingomonas sp. PvP018]|uniref:topoisomerase DNA-binding C4 zinc finger domain-containing protein n=1 Tax=Sphingomonas sp. PvP018 TaxID=2817852 RepID=UPI001AEA2074|nr:topoisomerase DNA-binding C4 zinc finger domain-containing protein [Sphingomonas sp. PvP018]MBP2513767.1 DNA-binding helix-hairpin-helix protein with protein kinase domain [Sphingomonas sp. PvP018]
MTVAYRNSSGTLIPAHRLGRGGEGEVFALADGSPRALKIYASPDAEREAKVLSMVVAGLARRCPGVAFPTAPAYALDGSFAGFVMPLVREGHQIHELCSPGSRRREYPNADWRFLVRTAVNTARVMERVHAAGAVVGDVNGAGVLVSRRAVVSLIDADSFQCGTEHLCRVGVPEFTPSELQGRSLTGVTRTVDHDAFGLAVLLFQLLFLGRHPHAGVPKGRDLPLVEAIAQNCFAYSRIQSVRLVPPRGTLLLSDLPLGLATLFERAFAGHGRRPLPHEWIAELERLEAAIVPCTRKEGHHVPTATGSCPWCRIERTTRTPVFGPGTPVASRRTSAVPVSASHGRSKAARVVARAKAEAGEHVRPRVKMRMPAASGFAASALVRLGVPTGLGVGRRSVLPADTNLAKGYVATHRRARRAMDNAVDDWRTRIGAWTVARSAEILATEALGSGAMTIDADRAIARVSGRLRDRLVADELSRLPLSAARVPGLGDRGVARLAAAGITRAADLSRAALEAVHGVGERGIVSLLLWHACTAVEIGTMVRLDPAAVAAAVEDIRRRSLEKEADRERRLVRLASELDVALDDLASRASLPDRRLEEAMREYQQTRADLHHLGLRKDGTAVPLASNASKPAQKRHGAARAACPVCGGPMVRRWPKSGASSNGSFLGCLSYPACTGARQLKPRTP